MAVNKTEIYAMVSFGRKEKEGEKNDSFFVSAYTGMAEAARLLDPKIKIEWHGPNAWDPAPEVRAIKELTTRNVAGIALSAADKEALNPAINEAMQTGIPVVTFDADAPSSERLTFIGTNNFKAGYLAGTTMADWLKGKGDVAVSTIQHVEHLDERLAGFTAAMDKFAPKTKIYSMHNTGNIVLTENGRKNGSEYRKSCMEMLQAHPKIRGIFITHGGQGHGPAKAIDDLKLHDKVYLLTFDFDEDTTNLVATGKIHSTVGQDPYLMGYISMVLMYYAKHSPTMPARHDHTWKLRALTDFLNTTPDIPKHITTKLTTMLSMLKENSGGTLEISTEMLGKDELLILLATSFEDIRNSMFERVSTLNEEIEVLQHFMSQIVNIEGRLENISGEMTQISTQMASGAEQTSQQVRVVSSNSQQISQHVNDTSVATEEVAANIREISHSIENVTESVTSAMKIANSANTTMSDLETHSQEIGEISKLITKIAQQTKFLALNATIEAARAGDSGQGFKVVADEVKELARETSTSAEDITHKIETIQSSSREAAGAITEVVKIINQVSDLSYSIATAIAEQAQTTNEISRTIADAAQGSDEISRAITEVATDAQDSSKRAVNVQAEAQGLSSLADQLRQLVERFKV